MNTQFNFTLKTDDDCFVDVEAIIRVRVLCFKNITNPAARLPAVSFIPQFVAKRRFLDFSFQELSDMKLRGKERIWWSR